MEAIETDFLIVGGGIAGVSCAEALACLCPTQKIHLLTESSLIKSVTNLIPLGKFIFQFDVEEQDAKNCKNVSVIMDRLKFIHNREKCVLTEQNRKISYKYLCLSTGARPNLITETQSDISKYVIGIRDTESVLEFQKRIKSSRKLAIVGNGGIASEIAFELKNIQVDWIIKDDHISSKFIDIGAAEFFKNNLIHKNEVARSPVVKRMQYHDEGNLGRGAALGPDWHRLLDIEGRLDTAPDSIKIHYHDEVKAIKRMDDSSEYPIKVELVNSNDEILCDFVVSATGVLPDVNFNADDSFKLGPDGGIFVDSHMRTSLEHIYAAGDLCYAGWEHSNLWFQMRLWTQARQMGMMAGKAMAAAFNNEEIYQDFCFELFGHVTKLFGYQVVLLGKFNGQGLNNKYEVVLRITPGKEYIKYVMVDGKLQGAILIGDTGLEETCENLILNQLDLSAFGEDILNPDVDIEDYFD